MQTFTRKPKPPLRDPCPLFVRDGAHGGFMEIHAGTSIDERRILPSAFSRWWWKETDANGER